MGTAVKSWVITGGTGELVVRTGSQGCLASHPAVLTATTFPQIFSIGIQTRTSGSKTGTNATVAATICSLTGTTTDQFVGVAL